MRDVAIPGARFLWAPLEELESPAAFRAQGGGAYGLAHLAADWLASMAGGDDALISFFGARTNEEDWQVTFERVFSMGVDDFYTSFAAHRAEVAPPTPPSEGRRARTRWHSPGRRHRPRPQCRAWICPNCDDWRRWSVWASAREWRVRPPTRCGRLPSSLVQQRLSGKGGDRTQLRVWSWTRGTSADLVITPSATAADTCRWRWIRGTVTDLAGDPLDGVRVSARTWVDSIEVVTLAWSDTTAGDGLFAIRVPEGRYGLSVRAGSVTGYYEGQRGFTLHRPNAAQIVSWSDRRQ